ncbi:hypothetical protein Arub01_29210 [Actinomadura rubrobrunea]|uniref:Uncharacterized protein n=1 Tax=Actinomadura rubrobrunea TaxID=115335 RepID=A0A9W6PXT3_9ACTN|nr:hypothetical protein Arub01_29210 [Actinomadura rubrobrunea]
MRHLASLTHGPPGMTHFFDAEPGGDARRDGRIRQQPRVTCYVGNLVPRYDSRTTRCRPPSNTRSTCGVRSNCGAMACGEVRHLPRRLWKDPLPQRWTRRGRAPRQPQVRADARLVEYSTTRARPPADPAACSRMGGEAASESPIGTSPAGAPAPGARP